MFNALCETDVQYKPFHNQLSKPQFPILMREVCCRVLDELACYVLQFAPDSPHAEHLLAFSCKRRGFCPSCGARRMAESAALRVFAIGLIKSNSRDSVSATIRRLARNTRIVFDYLRMTDNSNPRTPQPCAQAR